MMNTDILFKTHIDDSGNTDHRSDGTHFVLAGYLLPVKHWESFADVWAYQLAQPPQVKCFKMRQCESGKEGYFAGMAEEFRLCKLRDMAKVIAHFAPMAFTTHLRHDEYKAIVAGKVHPKLDSPYAILFYQIIRLVHEWQIDGNKKNPAMGFHPVDFVFDEQGQVGTRALRWYPALKANVREPYKRMFGALPEFKDDCLVVPLQAADILAWHIRRRLEFPEEDRPILDQISEHHAGFEIDAESLHDFVELTKRVDPQTLEDDHRGI
jgi:hypothetical protein